MNTGNEVDVDGMMVPYQAGWDKTGTAVLIGNASRQPDGTWRCLANVGGALVLAQVRVSQPNKAVKN